MSSRGKISRLPARPRLSFKQIAHIAEWAWGPTFFIGFGDSYASRRFPVLMVQGQQYASDVCKGLNHRFANQPFSPRLGSLPASAFPPHERLATEVSIREAQAGELHVEVAEAVRSVAWLAAMFAESLLGMVERGDVSHPALDEPAAETCYVFVRFFPGLREPCPLDRYVVLSDAELEPAMEADAERWAKENGDRIEEWGRARSRQRLGKSQPPSPDELAKVTGTPEGATQALVEAMELFAENDEGREKPESAAAPIAAQPGGKADGGQWSKPNGLEQWAKVFGFSTDTLKRRFRDGSIRHKKMSSKSYRIHVDDLPKAPTPPSSSKQK